MKQSLILLHGALGSTEQLVELKEILSKDYVVYLLNFSGHGGKLIEGFFSIDRFVADTLAFLDEHHLERSHIFGYSMGGYVALKLAYDHPARVNRIITLGTKFKWDPEAAARDVRMMNPEVIEQKIPAFAATLAARHQPADWKHIMTLTGEMMTRLGDGEAMKAADFAAIENQVLICIGKEDHMVSIDESEITTNHLKNGHLKIVEAFKHPIESVDKILLASICMEFYG